MLSHKYGAKVLVDACQSVPHMPVDVQKLGADFLVASSHKVNCAFIDIIFGESEVEMGILSSSFSILSRE